MLRLLVFGILSAGLLAGCAAAPRSTQSVQASDCAVTEPVWLTPPEDSAVQGKPEPGYYLVNEDRSIWAGASWFGRDAATLRADKDGVKVGWFRPAGAKLEISGQRLDGQSPPLKAEIPCCYPTRFQATGLIFPEAGCWQVTARAADSTLTFVVKVAEP